MISLRPTMPTIGRIDPGSDRAPFWRDILGSLEVRLLSPIPEVGKFPADDGGFEQKQFYVADAKALSTEQLRRAAELLGQKFNLAPEQILCEIHRSGIPVLADDLTVTFDARLVH